METGADRNIRFMRLALDEAGKALARGDRPIGAVIIHGDIVISAAASTFASAHNDVAHAELNAILQAAPYFQEHGHDCMIYTTCEPCVMCLGAIVMANIRQIVFGMPDHYAGGRRAIEAIPYLAKRVHRYEGGILLDECIAVYRRYSAKEVDQCLGLTTRQNLSEEAT